MLKKRRSKRRLGRKDQSCYNKEMKHPIEFSIAILILLAVAIVAFGVIWYAFQPGEQSAPNPIPAATATPNQ
jgi:hypothetical protein